MTPQFFYDQVASELMAGPPHPGLWARAYALADGDLAKARARYINLRVQQLEAEFVAEGERRQQRERREACSAALGNTGVNSEPVRRGWPYLTEEECIAELARFGHTATKEGSASWSIAEAGHAGGTRVGSVYELQRAIAELWQSNPDTSAA